MATDLGRLVRIVGGPLESYQGLLCSELGERIVSIDMMMNPTAAELYRYYRANGHDEDAAVQTALEVVDARVDGLRARLGLDQWTYEYGGLGGLPDQGGG